MRSWVGIEEGNIYKNVSYVKCGNECSHVSWECSTYIYIYIYIYSSSRVDFLLGHKL